MYQLDDVTAWIATRPASETFPAAAGCNCLFCQYGEAMGLGSAWDASTYAKTIALVDLTEVQREMIVCEPRTFGHALDRANKLRGTWGLVVYP